MKLLLVFLLALTLSACADNTLKDIGYSDDEIKVIESLSDDSINIIEKEPYDSELMDLINDPTFDEAKLDEYLALDGLDADDRLMIVNKGYYSDTYDATTLALMKTSYYIHDRLDRYLAYIDSVGETDLRSVVEHVNCDRDHEVYTDTMVSDTSKGDLMIANKYYTIEDYVPEDLVHIDSYYGLDAYLDRDTYEAYTKMADQMMSEGIDVWITSAYRSYDSQVNIYNRYLAIDPQEVVDTYSARPGFSDHQTGRVVDLIEPGGDLGSFEYTDAKAWLDEHAYEYGFILRYPEDKEDITGYMYESWHYRYVGKEVAKYIHDTGITFDEYYAYFIGS